MNIMKHILIILIFTNGIKDSHLDINYLDLNQDLKTKK